MSEGLGVWQVLTGMERSGMDSVNGAASARLQQASGMTRDADDSVIS